MNLEVFNNLTPGQQKIIEVAAGEGHQANYAVFIANNGPALKRLKAGGTQVMEFPDDVWDAFGRASKEVLDGFMSDELFAKIRASAEASQAATSGWLSVSDAFYVKQRNRVNGA